ncbi:S41 family peptidase [Cytobacillus praedii]|uniref:S41 family peptidase n=1 Tax=Cytobacillus praedii TaxID=1742358 RepID=UPI002E1DA46A|nr:S41 family peptidase [Cytobacillus praedii]MED3551326.1 S41 family peptidase [Cytobacillus praedii]
MKIERKRNKSRMATGIGVLFFLILLSWFIWGQKEANPVVMLEPDEMQEDFQFLIDEMLAKHPDPSRKMTKEVWDKRIAEIKSELDSEKSTTDFYFILQEFVAEMEDAHTGLVMLDERRRLPLLLDWTEEGWTVLESGHGVEKGDLIVSLGGMEVEEIVKELGRFVSAENPYWKRFRANFLIKDEYFLKNLSLVKNNQVVVTVEKIQGEKRKVKIPLVKKELADSQISDAEENWYNSYKRFNDSNTFGWSIDHENDIGYYYLHACDDTREYRKSVSLFFKEVKKEGIGNIVIDLRQNAGGNSAVIDAFINRIQPSNMNNYTNFSGNTFVLISNHTFSSANMFASVIQDNNIGILVGEPTGNSPFAFGEVISGVLPNSKINLSLSTKEYILSKTYKDAIYPDYLVPKTRESIISNKDIQLEKVIELIKEK